MLNRRNFTSGMGIAAIAALPGCKHPNGAPDMYGIISKMIAHENKRDALITVLLNGTNQMPGCLSYVVSKDLSDDNALWITEFWESQAHHQRSLSLASVQQAISRGKPMIAGFGERIEISPIGGHGLS